MDSFLNRLKYGWSFMRLLRLVLGLILIGEAVYKLDWMFAIMGAVLLVQAAVNVACCSGGTCDSNHSMEKPASASETLENTTFTEVK